jgi:glycine/serine hydroxymethyltransferase
VTTRGFREVEMGRIAELIDDVLTRKDDGTLARVKQDVRELTDAFPLYATRRPAVRAAR